MPRSKTLPLQMSESKTSSSKMPSSMTASAALPSCNTIDTERTNLKTLPYELKREVLSHHIDNLLDDVLPTYSHGNVMQDIKSASGRRKAEWLDYHPFYTALTRTLTFWPEMEDEIESLCRTKLKRNYPRFADSEEHLENKLGKDEYRFKFAAEHMRVGTSVFNYFTEKAKNEAAEAEQELRWVDNLYALQTQAEQILLLQNQMGQSLRRNQRIQSIRKSRLLPGTLAHAQCGRRSPFDYQRSAMQRLQAIEKFKRDVTRAEENRIRERLALGR